MDALAKTRKLINASTHVTERTLPADRPTRDEAMEAVRTLIAWAGDNPDREGLLDTPRRVVDAYGEWFDGYEGDPGQELSRTFEDVQGYDDVVMLRGIEVESHCEHHMAPFLGKAYVAYVPNDKVVGISKLARVVMHWCSASIMMATPLGSRCSWMALAICWVRVSWVCRRREKISTTRASLEMPTTLSLGT